MKRLALILLTLVILSACGGQSTTIQATPTPIPTPIIPTKPTYTVERGDIEKRVKFTGRVVPKVEEELFFGVGGRVDEVMVKQGDMVKAGDLLAVLETGNREFDLKRAQIYLEMAQLALDSTELQTPKTSKLYTVTIDMKKKELELAQLGVDELNKAVADARIVATMDGMVRSLLLANGSVVEAFKPVVVLSEITSLEVAAEVSGDTMGSLEEGMPVLLSTVVLDSDAIGGVIRSLPYPYGSGSKESRDTSVRIEANQDLSQAGFALGDLVEVLVLLEKKVDVLWLPPQAVRTFEGRRFVVVRDGDGQRRVDVRLGLQGEDRVEILDGVEEGMTILAP